MLKPEERGSEYPAWLCPTCFEQGVKGFLQFIAKLRGAGSIYRCSQCKSHTMVQGGPRWLCGEEASRGNADVDPPAQQAKS